MQDKKLICRDCGQEFIWSAGEQEFFLKKGFTNPPTRCQSCRDIYREKKKTGDHLNTIECHKCGQKGQVPFTSKNEASVLCRNCYQSGLTDDTIPKPTNI